MNVSPPSSSPRRAKHHGRPASNSTASSSPGARPNDNARAAGGVVTLVCPGAPHLPAL